MSIERLSYKDKRGNTVDYGYREKFGDATGGHYHVHQFHESRTGMPKIGYSTNNTGRHRLGIFAEDVHRTATPSLNNYLSMQSTNRARYHNPNLKISGR